MPKVPILMPQLGDSIAEATVLRLLAAEMAEQSPNALDFEAPELADRLLGRL